MTPDEQSLLQRFLQDLTQTRGPAKDPDADRQINEALRSSPDAPYVLVQHAILSDQALHAAQAQVADLQQQLRNAGPPAAAPSSGFLGGGQSPWARAAAPQPAPAPYPGPGPFNNGGGLGSFLRGAGTTAAGVVGGGLLFEGISSLFGGGRGFGGGFGGGGFGGGPPVENVTNNYYSDDNNDGGGDSGGGWDSGGDNGGGDNS